MRRFNSSLIDIISQTKQTTMMFQVLICSAIVSLVLIAWKVSNWVWFQPKKLEKLLREQGYRGNPYRLVHGDLKDMSKMFQEAYSKPISISDDITARVIPPYLQILQKHGKRSYLWLGPKPGVLIMEPDLIKEVANKMEKFPKPNSNPLAKYLARGLVSYEGQKWAKHRKLLNPAFHMEKLKLMLPAFYASTSDMLSKWENIALEKGPAMEVDVWPHLQTMTADVISRTAFGSSFEEGRKIFELQREQARLFVEANRSLYVPGSKFLPTGRNKRMKQISQEVNSSITDIINARLKSMKSGEWNGKDMLGMLLESNAQETGMHGNRDSGMSIQDVIEECKLFYFAGQETTSTLLVWTMILLSRFPDWQSRAREEVLQIFGSSDKPDFDKLNQLKIVNMILHEVLRLYTPLAVLARKTVKETTIGDLTLPAGVMILLPTMLMHYDSESWGDDAKEFKPERFADGVSHATKGQVVFFPFGWGPRICIGQNFAMLEAKLALAMVLQRFSFELSPSYSHAPYSSITLQPQHGAHLILHKL